MNHRHIQPELLRLQEKNHLAGEHTREVLHDLLGYTRTEIDGLAEEGVLK